MQIKDVKTLDQQLNLIFHAILAGPLLFYCIAYLRTIKGEIVPAFGEPSMNLKLVICAFCGLLVFGAFYIYKRQITEARMLPTLHEKMGKLFSGSIINYAIIEFASIIAVLMFFLTHEHIFTAVYVGILLLMSLNRPIREKYANDLRLKGKEREGVLKKKELSNTPIEEE